MGWKISTFIYFCIFAISIVGLFINFETREEPALTYNFIGCFVGLIGFYLNWESNENNSN